MTALDRHKDEFRRAKAEYRWTEFVRLLSALGYVQKPNRKTTGSARTFYHPVTRHIVKDHEPHNGRMYRDQIKRLRATLESEGLL